MSKLPQNAQLFMNENNLELLHIVQYSEWKKTYIVSAEDQDKKQYILKIIESESPQEIKEKFYNEVEFYKQHSLSFVPRYIQNNDFILQIEFVEAITFRECLLKEKVTNEQVSLLFKNTFELYESIENKQLNSTDFNKAYSHLGALATSGPIQTKDMKVSFFDKIFARVVLKILRYRLKLVLDSIDFKNLRFGFSHGDMHYNNILITKLNEIKLIDFENINYDGFYDFDLMYLYVMVELYLTDNKFIEVKKDIVNEICISEKKLLRIINLYRISVLLNKKFQVGLDLESSKLKLLFRSLYK